MWMAFSLVLVAFGQPAWFWWSGLVAAFAGYAFFWKALLSFSTPFSRFCISSSWFACVQMIQLSWVTSHPYLYIYLFLYITSLLLGLQWGALSLLVTYESLKNWSNLFAIAACWTLLEWLRLFILSGFPFNPVGLALTGSIYSMQLASIGGVYFLSYWVIITNLFVLKAWLKNKKEWLIIAFTIAALPYLFGFFHLRWHNHLASQSPKYIETLLVQTAFPVEEKICFANFDQISQFLIGQWKKIFTLLAPYQLASIELVVLPENLVPYGTYLLVFPYEQAVQIWEDFFGFASARYLPPLQPPFADLMKVGGEERWYVNNGYFSQALANLFHAHLVIGLEDQLFENNKIVQSYSAALHFQPRKKDKPVEVNRYEKRVLVPMGEYIPFKWCQMWAAKYGVSGSFSSGKSARIFNGPVPLGPSICYEEIFGHLMRENRLKGAELFINLTNDGWYPFSKLPKQHFDHSRLRAVENGIPLVRACNTGVTSVIDSLGQIVAVWGEEKDFSYEKAGLLKASVPTYHFSTLYTYWGDHFIITLISCSFFYFFLKMLYGILWIKK